MSDNLSFSDFLKIVDLYLSYFDESVPNPHNMRHYGLPPTLKQALCRFSSLDDKLVTTVGGTFESLEETERKYNLKDEHSPEDFRKVHLLTAKLFLRHDPDAKITLQFQAEYINWERDYSWAIFYDHYNLHIHLSQCRSCRSDKGGLQKFAGGCALPAVSFLCARCCKCPCGGVFRISSGICKNLCHAYTEIRHIFLRDISSLIMQKLM